jgi:hypothetical protein
MMDAGATDAGATDATDAGMMDAGATDAGMMDAGAMDGGAMDAGGAVTFAMVWSQIIDGTCTPCHAAGSGSLFMSTEAEAYGNLVGATATQACGTVTQRVVAGDPANSKMYKKVSSTDCGTQMPASGGPLTQAKIDLIFAWIEGGALP